MTNFKFSYVGFMVATILALSLVCGCSDNGDNEPAPAPERVISFNTSIPASLSDKDYPVNINLPESVFDDATILDKNLSIVSFAGSQQTGKEAKIRKFYTDAGFDNIKTNDNYDVTSADSISYSFAHKKVGEYDLVAVIVRGVNYGLEWSNNIKIGAEGDHEGFLASANKVYDALCGGAESYINTNYETEYKSGKLKLWITGFSRAGAVSNVLSYLILGDELKKLTIEQKNVFVYTFESPRALVEAHATAFPNVFNFIFESDMVTHLAPESYGLYRCGIDKVLFDANEDSYTKKRSSKRQSPSSSKIKTTRWFVTPVDERLARLDPDISIPGFLIQDAYHEEGEEPSFPPPDYKTEKDLINFIFDKVMEKGDDSTGGYSFKTRELFAAKIQEPISYALSVFMQDTSVLTAIGDIAKSDFNKAIQWITVEGEFYKTLTPILDEKSVTYDPAKLEATCNAVFQMIDYKTYNGCLTTAVLYMLPLFLSDGKDFNRIIDQHYSEVIYASLLDL